MKNVKRRTSFIGINVKQVFWKQTLDDDGRERPKQGRKLNFEVVRWEKRKGKESGLYACVHVTCKTKTAGGKEP